MSFAGEDSHCSSVVVENLKKTVEHKSEGQPKVTRLKLPTADLVIVLLNFQHIPHFSIKRNDDQRVLQIIHGESFIR